MHGYKMKTIPTTKSSSFCPETRFMLVIAETCQEVGTFLKYYFKMKMTSHIALYAYSHRIAGI